MGGATARFGFTYQDRYLMKRVLQDVGDQALSGKRCLVVFGLESLGQAETSEDGPLWDVVVRCVPETEVVEVKSGAVTAMERRVFWRRIRREFNRGGGDALVSVLVCDPAKADGLDHWRGLSEAATKFPVGELEPFKGNVVSAATLCAEAMDGLCGRESSSDTALTAKDALAVLQRFRLELELAEDLKRKVDQGIEVFLPNGFTDPTRQLIHGWLNDKAINPDRNDRKFTSQELVAAVGAHQACLSLTSGELETWKALWVELPSEFRRRAQARLGKTGPTISVLDGQPVAGPYLLALKPGGTIALGNGGGGKSGLARQIADEMAVRNPDSVFVVAADDMTPAQIETFCKSMRFKKGLCRFKEPDSTFTLIVDALDEAELGLREEWAKALARLAEGEGFSILVTMREGVWQADNSTKKHLEKWQQLAVADWPESLVLSHVSGPAPQVVESLGLKTLLRQPLMLDLFWRTFVEEAAPTRSADIPSTRYQLLSRFWEKCIAQSPRHHEALPPNRLQSILAAAAESHEPFELADSDVPGAQALVSESVLVRDGRLAPKLRFRHLLLRDFALSLWCLGAKTPAEVIVRWSSIKGGLRRNGALRALLDAISDAAFETDFPQLRWRDLLAELVKSGEGQDQLAQVLGTMECRPELDPNHWPSAVQDALQASFGRKLITFAETHLNTSWAEAVRHWQPGLGWIDLEFAEALFSYAERSKRIAEESRNPKQRADAALLAGKLRDVSEQPRFEAAFAALNRHLKMRAIGVIVPQLPNFQTLEWLERELPISSWFTRSWMLEVLIHLAAVDAARTATIYRHAVGLCQKEGRWQLSRTGNERTHEHMTLDGSLGGIDSRRSLLLEYPTEFAPVAVEMAEATSEVDVLVVDGIVDDGWMFWGLSGLGSAHQYVAVLKKKALELAERNPDLFLSAVVPAVVSSQLLSVHSVLLEALWTHRTKPGLMARLKEALKDPRLYHFPNLGYWMQQALQACWPELSVADKADILRILEATEGAINHGRQHAGRLAAFIPEGELTEPLQVMAGEQRGSPGCAYPHLAERERFHDLPVPFDDPYAHFVEGWPLEFPQEHLAVLARASDQTNRHNISADDLRVALARIGDSITALLPAIEANRNDFFNADRYWLIERIEHFLQRHWHREMPAPPADIVRRLTDLAMAELETANYSVGDHVHDFSVIANSESSWSRALELLNVLLFFDPAKADDGVNQRFTSVLRNAFASSDKFVQALIAHSLSPEHWRRNPEQIALYDELFWSIDRDPLVTNSGLQTLLRMPDAMRATNLRKAFMRSPEDLPAKYPERLGRALGLASFFMRTSPERTRVARLTEEVISNPSQFPFLQSATGRQECLREMAFGMSEQLGHFWFRLEFVSDYVRWMLGIWRTLKPLRHPGYQSEQVVSSVFNLLKEAKKPASEDKLKDWWPIIRPFAMAVAQEGGQSDCFYLFFYMRDGEFNSLIPRYDLFELVQLVVDRLSGDVPNGNADLKSTDSATEVHQPWAEVLRHATATLDSLAKNNLLRSDSDREQCRHLLARLASSPFDIDFAAAALSRLQSEGI